MLALEAKYQIDDRLFDELLSGGTEVALTTYEAMIDAGEYNPDIFVVKKGLVRGTYLDKNSEKTVGFALPGTLLMSLHCYYGNEPSYYRFEACCATEVIRIPRSWFDGLIEREHEFARWVMSANQNQLYYNEFRSRLLSGDAKSRFVQLTRRLSEITPEVPADIIGFGGWGWGDAITTGQIGNVFTVEGSPSACTVENHSVLSWYYRAAPVKNKAGAST